MTRLQTILALIGFTIAIGAVGGIETGGSIAAGIVWMMIGLALMALGTPRRL